MLSKASQGTVCWVGGQGASHHPSYMQLIQGTAKADSTPGIHGLTCVGRETGLGDHPLSPETVGRAHGLRKVQTVSHRQDEEDTEKSH